MMSINHAEEIGRRGNIFHPDRPGQESTLGSIQADLLRSTRAFARDLIYAAGRLPVIGGFVVDAQKRRFNATAGANVRIFNGIYPDFASAERAIPARREAGYDNKASANRLLNEFHVMPSDYPALFWLSRLIPSAAFLFDWGGNVGLKYFAYRKYLSYPASFTWCVCDVPAVVAAGEEIARREEANALSFTTTLDELSNADILFAAGAIHLIEKPLLMLHDATALPRHVVLSKVPAYDASAAVTLQNMGTAFCPNHLFNRAELVQGFFNLGYRLVDDWISPEFVCEIPFHPERSVRGYSGFYFVKSDPLDGAANHLFSQDPIELDRLDTEARERHVPGSCQRTGLGRRTDE